jgi:AraC family transcriptional regulator, activator of mtrCDE
MTLRSFPTNREREIWHKMRDIGVASNIASSMRIDFEMARALAEIIARPGDRHSVMTLSRSVGLSRSVFSARFTSIFRCSPMAAVRQLRMRRAAKLLSAHILSIEQVAQAVGYRNNRGFVRAFRQIYGEHPSNYRDYDKATARSISVTGQFSGLR